MQAHTFGTSHIYLVTLLLIKKENLNPHAFWCSGQVELCPAKESELIIPFRCEPALRQREKLRTGLFILFLAFLFFYENHRHHQIIKVFYFVRNLGKDASCSKGRPAALMRVGH